ncbi:MAG: M1 family aminopeptidase [bacterium]
MKSILTFCGILSLLVISVATPAFSQDIPDIRSHNLTVWIVPNEKSLEATDDVTLTSPPNGSFSFTLNKNMTIRSIMVGQDSLDFQMSGFEGDNGNEVDIPETLSVVTVELPEGIDRFTVNYAGVIYDPINPSTALGRVRGDFTSGIISEDGVFLSSESGWYPDTENSMALYGIMVILPKGWESVTQGDLMGREEFTDGSTTIWKSDIPADGCVLVANKYFIRSLDIDGVKCSTYFYNDNPDLSDSFLNKLDEYLPAYVNLFGPFPYSRFDIVENFFSSGYGMPGFTLLGSRVLTMPYATAEGSLAHELVHNWWGNVVFPDWNSGNWCEGVTYFSTNYYWNILSGQPEKAREFRFREMVKYALTVSPDKDYPVREFRTKMTEEDACIGYSKSGGIFIMLQQMLGDEKFFSALRLMIERYSGKKATWDDFKATFEEVSGRDLGNFFSTWLDNKGVPSIEMTLTNLPSIPGVAQLTMANVVQTGDPFYIELPVRITNGENSTDLKLECFDSIANILIEKSETPTSIDIDPDYFIFRKLSHEEIPPCLNSTIKADKLLIVIPEAGEDATLTVQNFMGPMPGTREVSVKDLYKEIADSVTESGKEAVIKYPSEVRKSDVESSAILCLGAPNFNATASILAMDSGKIEFPGLGQFTFNGTDYPGETVSALISMRNPYNDSYDMTLSFGNSPAAIFKASYMFFYGWDSWVIYDGGNPIDRGQWPMGTGPLHVEIQ